MHCVFPFPDQWPRLIQVAAVMGDCHSSAVTRRPAVAHAGGVKIYAFPLHVYSLMAPLKLSGFMRSSWVPVVPCLLVSLAFSPRSPCTSQSGMKVLAENKL